jgi:hypothetical protein
LDEHGAAWLGRVNLYKENPDQRIMWEWDETPHCSVAAVFVLPRYDEELERMIRERDETPYTGTAGDSKLVNAIFDRIEALGGQALIWN